MADSKITDLSAIDAPIVTDILPVVDDPAGTPVTKKATFTQVADLFKDRTETLTNKRLTSPKINEDVALTATATQLNNVVANTSGSNTGDQTLPVKATATENVAGTDDAKFITALANVPAFNNSMARQAIINGNFDVWQRGTTSALADGTTLFLADRWAWLSIKDGGTAPTITVSRQIITSGAVSNAFYCARIAVDGAGTSLGNSSQGRLRTTIEHGTRLLCGDGKKITISFWARSDIANKKFGLVFQQNYGTGGSPTTGEYLTGSVISLTSSWVKYTYTFTTNTLASKTFGTDNNDFIDLRLMYMWGSTNATNYNLTGTETYVGAGYVDIAQVQLCAGDVALPFMPKSFEEELRACQRYYEKSYDYATAIGTVSNLGAFFASASGTTSYFKMTISYKVSKRSTPTIAYYSPSAGTSAKATVAGSDQNVATISGGDGQNNIIAQLNNVAATEGQDISVHWTSSAEL